MGISDKKAKRLIQEAIEFYIRQNYLVGANMFEMGYASDGYSRACFKRREELRQAIDWARHNRMQLVLFKDDA